MWFSRTIVYGLEKQHLNGVRGGLIQSHWCPKTISVPITFEDKEVLTSPGQKPNPGYFAKTTSSFVKLDAISKTWIGNFDSDYSSNLKQKNIPWEIMSRFLLQAHPTHPWANPWEFDFSKINRVKFLTVQAKAIVKFPKLQKTYTIVREENKLDCVYLISFSQYRKQKNHHNCLCNPVLSFD
jgi:hypothetical protein